jgi:hypothetical protein
MTTTVATTGRLNGISTSTETTTCNSCRPKRIKATPGDTRQRAAGVGSLLPLAAFHAKQASQWQRIPICSTSPPPLRLPTRSVHVGQKNSLAPLGPLGRHGHLGRLAKTSPCSFAPSPQFSIRANPRHSRSTPRISTLRKLNPPLTSRRQHSEPHPHPLEWRVSYILPAESQ